MPDNAVATAPAARETRLKEILAGYGTLAVAYSGGVDSTYLADVAHDVLGDKLHLITNDSVSLPRDDFHDAVELATKRGWKLHIIHTEELQDERFVANDDMRCYYCKGGVFDAMLDFMRRYGIEALAHGENVDDLRDTTRVGVRAAEERGVIAPLKEAGLTKEDIRELSRQRDLPTADKPSMACLYTRIPTGIPIRLEEVQKVDKVEAALKRLGFHQYRARHHDRICRIELSPEELERAAKPDVRARIVAAVRDAGYRHATLDLAGYRAKS